ncbi:MAG: type IV toxin-antitoxin system AbiEi family antitoxin domain-containing protein [Proteobacteria bacterium]|nr:type IV toxin-antitoxin system AbiEi family antitoxin domain-containing protein [Pseudomonadota bacterium]
MKPENLESRVAQRIARKRGDVFLRDDFRDLGGYDQVGRALRGLVRKGRLVKLGYGLYTRASPSPFSGKPTPVKGLRALGNEALGRLGIDTSPTRLEQANTAGLTTQVSSGRTVAVGRRVRRRIGYNGTYLSFERAGPAPR